MSNLFFTYFNLEKTSYWLLLIWLIGMGLILYKMPKKEELICGHIQERWYWFTAVLLTFPLVLWAAYRPFIGDTGAYARRFMEAPLYLSDVPAYMSRFGKDQGFTLLIVALKLLGVPNYNTFFLILAAFQLWCLIFTFRRYSPNYWISIFMFIASTDYLSWMFNGIRQFTAVCITFAAFPLLVDRKYIRFTLMTLLAYTFHASALLMLPLAYIMQGPALNRKTMLTIICAVLCVPFIDRFTPILELLLADTQYGDVMTNEIWTSDDGTNIIRVLVYSAPALVVFFGYRYIINSKDRVMNLCINASILTMALYLVSAVTSGIYVGRLPIYTTLQGYMVLPWVIDQVFEKSSARLIKMVMILCYLATFYYQMHFIWDYL